MELNSIEIINFWFSNPQFWFDASHEDDIKIAEAYKPLCDSIFAYDNDVSANILLPTGAKNDNSFLTKEYKNNSLGLIILYDQIGRHICRVHHLDHTPYFNRAYVIAKSIISNNELLETYTPEERVFILLVYRHTFDKTHIEEVIEIVQKWRYNNNLPIYRRFYQASLNSLAKINNKENLLYVNHSGYMNATINSVLDENLSPKIEEVLSFNNIKLFKSIYDEEIYKIFEASMIEALRIKSNVSRTIGISVSGGVDSMVCTLLTYSFSNKYGYNPVVFSVNYGNRIEQNIEIYMVNKYVELLNHIFDCYDNNHYMRLISEIKRTQDCDRDLYEDFTRNIRFECYKNVSAVTCNTNHLDLPFILGHNRDDSLENVISNIKKERSYQNLFGMNLVGNEKDVTLFRPLLTVWKRDIVTFAQKYKVPFVYDSTPAWSERGKMRDILFPFLNQFDSRILDGLFSLSTNFKEIYKVYENSLPEMEYNEKNVVIEDKQIYFEDYFKKILQKVCVHFHFKPIKNKAIAHLVNTLKDDVNTHRITLSKELIAIRDIENQKIIFIKK